MGYGSPGNADTLPQALAQEWNALIERTYRGLEDRWGSRFFSLNPNTIANPVGAAAIWFGQPAEPTFCLGRNVAIQLSDWGVRGRHATHNEYCEYRVVHRSDRSGTMRPKRVQITTELREYWTTMAMYDPEFLRDRAVEILGREVSWEELYGVGISSPDALDLRERRIRFSREVAGHGNHDDLIGAGVPGQPTGALNRDNILFMTHPINGLDDLLYIVMFGAHPWAVISGDAYQKASKEAIFRANKVTHLACRNADPAAATTAHSQAFDGRTVAFADPLGVTIQSFSKGKFLYNGSEVPDDWVRLSRGVGDPARPLGESSFQRLVFGPDDRDDVFLDEVVLALGNALEPVTGGYQVASQLEVGSKVLVGETTEVTQAEFHARDVSNADAGPIACSEAAVCKRIKDLKDEYDNAQASAPGGMMVRPRATMGMG